MAVIEISCPSFNRVCKSFSHDSLDESELSCDILERFTRHRGIGMDPTPRAPFTREGGRFSRALMASGAMAALLASGAMLCDQVLLVNAVDQG
jgi:hypothetical protein